MKIPIVSRFLSRLSSQGHASDRAKLESESLGLGSWNDDELELKVETLLADKASKSYGTVQAITLSTFKDDLGNLWDNHQKSIRLIAETTIERMLGKGQTVIQEDDLTWLLVTPDLRTDEAEVFATTIASSIGEKLVGARLEPSGELDPTPSTGLVDLSKAIAEDGSIDRGALQSAIANARAAIAARDRRKHLPSTKVNKIGKSREAPSIAPKNVKTPDTRTLQITAEDGLKLSYWPTWSADSQSLDTFFCRAVGDKDGDPFQRDDPSQVAANAIAVARASIMVLNSMIKDGVRAKLVIPIPFSALLSSAQRPILHALEKLEDAHRFLYLRTEIVSVHRSVSTTAILTARDLLLPLVRDVAVLTDLCEPNNAVLASSKITIGCDAGSDGNSSSKKFRTSLQNSKAQ